MPPEQKREEYQKVGMNWLQSHAVRAEVCAGCHIGAPAEPGSGLPDRDMNHDFIAAGHPRLMFEYGSFLANEPKHWKEKDTRADFEARAWLVGQVVSAQSALRLSADRATTTAAGRVWPELAEYDCYACHHDLVGKSWRQQRGFPPGRIGALRPSEWYTALLPVVASAAPRKPGLSLAALSTTLSQRSPDGATISQQVKEILTAMGPLPAELEKTEYDRAAIVGLRQKLVATANDRKRTDWDVVEQVALGLRALEATEQAIREKTGEQPSPEDVRITDSIRELLEKLAFPPGANSPRNFRRNSADEVELNKILGKLK
jgi:hypothetical protein